MDHTQNNKFAYQALLYIITAGTNMHVGSGEESYGLVDNRVQRDVLNNLPNINASGLKGAFREHFERKKGKESQEIIDIFGSDSFSKTEASGQHQAGKFRFFNGNLLSLPVRSDVRPFFRATSVEVLQELIDNLDTFSYKDTYRFRECLERLSGLKVKEGEPLLLTGDKEALLEDYNLKAKSDENRKLDLEHLEMLERLMGKNIVLLHNSDFTDICSDYNLPLIARNKLENGRSVNLWHEQVVPRESKFYFFVLKPGGSNHDLEFTKGEPVQIGANASIGYGFCRVEEVSSIVKAAMNKEQESGS
ncbi:MAG: type III-B CRISPR module RAMP protein Cmr4 [Candidatus Aminicenantes bacterium]|nr:type III-B CRISPR module RAMP protein Cmr4 [Candidatus Aminicenantes bacterium]